MAECSFTSNTRIYLRIIYACISIYTVSNVILITSYKKSILSISDVKRTLYATSLRLEENVQLFEVCYVLQLLLFSYIQFI